MSPVGYDHGGVVIRLGALLLSLFPELGVVTEVGLRLPRNRLRAPDLMLVSSRPEDRWVTEPPLLVIEVLSPATRSEDTIRKSMEYAEGGVGQFWVVDPELRAIDLWRNADGEWELLARVDDDHPAAEVELAGVTVPIDLRQILRD
jgi:Uma2 family endonuclease